MALCVLQEQQLAEAVEVDATDLGVQGIAGEQAPAIAPRLTFAAVFYQCCERLAKTFELTESVHGCQILAGRFGGRNTLGGIAGLGFQCAVIEEGYSESARLRKPVLVLEPEAPMAAESASSTSLKR
jgi:hypothetical protein